MFSNISIAELTDCLAQTPQAQLKGLVLLKQYTKRRKPHRGQWFPVDVSSRLLAEAATEMMDYMSGCERAMENLKRLPPVPSAAPVEEWPL